MKSVYYDDKGLHLDVEERSMWKEAMKGNQLNDERTGMVSKIFGTVLKGVGQLTVISLYKTRSLGEVAIVNCKQIVTELAPVPHTTLIKKLRYPVQGKYRDIYSNGIRCSNCLSN